MKPITMTGIPSAMTIQPRHTFIAMAGLLVGLASTVETWRRSHKARRQFSRIDARTLRDVGISEAQRFLLSEL